MDIIPDISLEPADKVAVTAYITRGESISITKKRTSTPNYFRIGNGTMNKHKIQSIDLLEIIANASKAGQFLILAIKSGIGYENDYHHIVPIKAAELTSTQKQYLKLGFKELHAIDVVRRFRNGLYMLNPNALIPLDYDQAIIDWNSCKPLQEVSN